jgi:hypothetical protein
MLQVDLFAQRLPEKLPSVTTSRRPGLFRADAIAQGRSSRLKRPKEIIWNKVRYRKDDSQIRAIRILSLCETSSTRMPTAINLIINVIRHSINRFVIIINVLFDQWMRISIAQLISTIQGKIKDQCKSRLCGIEPVNFLALKCITSGPRGINFPSRRLHVKQRVRPRPEWRNKETTSL